MKNIMILSAMAGVLVLSGCSTLKNVVGEDNSGMHDVHASANMTAPVTERNGILVDANKHMTLYTFDKDKTNMSECGKACLVAWPAFLAPSNAKTSGAFSAFQREDGKYQWTVGGKPLYFYANDKEAGDKHGDNKGDVWHVVPLK